MPTAIGPDYRTDAANPADGGGVVPSPAINPPPEVQAVSVLGVVDRYALEDHTHRSPTIYWGQGVGPTDAIVANRSSFITVTTAGLSGATNWCSYDPASTSAGLTGNFGTIGGGYENSAGGLYSAVLSGFQGLVDSEGSVVAGGSTNNIDSSSQYSFIGGGGFGQIIATRAQSFYSVVSGGYFNSIFDSVYSTVSGGDSNQITGSAAGNAVNTIGGGSSNQIVGVDGATIPGGYLALCYVPGQMARAAGSVTGVVGESQGGDVQIDGSTPGLATNESVELVPRVTLTDKFLTRQNRVYTIMLIVSASRSTGTDTWSSVIMVSAYTSALGVLTIIGQTTLSVLGTPATALYNVTVTAGAAPNRFVVTFRTGAGNAHQTKVHCVAIMSEIKNG